MNKDFYIIGNAKVTSKGEVINGYTTNKNECKHHYKYDKHFKKEICFYCLTAKKTTSQ